jgi:hypothetical protein
LIKTGEYKEIFDKNQEILKSITKNVLLETQQQFQQMGMPAPAVEKLNL